MLPRALVGCQLSRKGTGTRDRVSKGEKLGVHIRTITFLDGVVSGLFTFHDGCGIGLCG